MRVREQVRQQRGVDLRALVHHVGRDRLEEGGGEQRGGEGEEVEGDEEGFVEGAGYEEDCL